MTNREKLERAEHEIYCLAEAASYLEQARDMDGVIDELKSRMIVLGFEKEEYHRLVEQEDEEEENALLREYYRAVI